MERAIGALRKKSITLTVRQVGGFNGAYFNAVPDPVIPEGEFHGELRKHDIGRSIIFESIFSNQWIRHGLQQAPDRSSNPLLLFYCLEGGCQGYNGWRAVQASAGEACLLDLRWSLDIRTLPSHILALILPHDLIIEPGGRYQELASRCDSLFGKVLGNLLQSVWQQAGSGLQPWGGAVDSMLKNSVVSVFSQEVTTESPVLTPSQQTIFQKVQFYIEAHLEEKLDIDDLCRHSNCSRSTLYRLFKSYGGAYGYVHWARLNRCLEELSGLNGVPPRITKLSSKFQFSDPSHFTHSFKEMFGIAPSKIPNIV